MADNKAVTTTVDSPKIRAERVLYHINEVINTALPSTVSRDKFRDVFMTAAIKEPKIFAADRTSLQQALIASANSGLLPDGKMAALVPFKNTKANKTEVQFIVMVMGYIHLFKKHAGVHSMAVNVVFEKDEFEYIEGDTTVLRHKPDSFAEDRGEMVGVYGIFKDAEGRVMHREIMGRAAVMKAKAVSKMSGSGPWQQFEEEMWRKTLVRRAAKYLPLTEEGQRVLDAEDAATIDFSLPARQIDQAYNPLTSAAGIEDHADEDGVVHEDGGENGGGDDSTPFDTDNERDQGEQDQGEQDQGEQDQEDDIDLDNVTEREDQADEKKSVEVKPNENVVDLKPKTTAAKPSDRELDAAWDAGCEAKEQDQPREAPADIHPALAETWLKAWDKSKVKPKEKTKAKETPREGVPAEAIEKDARAKALDGAERMAPSGYSNEEAARWEAIYDEQVKDADQNG